MATAKTARFPLSVSLHTLELGQGLDTIGLLAGSAVRSVELWEPTFAKDDGFVQAARTAFATAGVEPRTVHANFGGALDISSLDPAVRAAGMASFGVALDLAVRMDARMVVLHPSSEPIRDEDRAARMAQARRSIAAAAAMARDAGRQVAIELLPRTCLGRSAAELLALLDGVAPAAAGICLDVNHLMNAYASLPDVVRSVGPRLLALHCSDYDGVDEKHWPPLRGVIDWAAFLAALQAAGFTGPFHYEAALDGKTPAEKLAFVQANYAQVMGL